MHDFHEADRIHKIVLEEAKKNNLKKVKEINLELGSVVEHGEEILAENLKFNIAMLNKGTVAEGAVINIVRTGDNTWKLVSISGE